MIKHLTPEQRYEIYLGLNKEMEQKSHSPRDRRPSFNDMP